MSIQDCDTRGHSALPESSDECGPYRVNLAGAYSQWVHSMQPSACTLVDPTGEVPPQVLQPAGRKDDAGKVRLELLPLESLTEVARVLTFGANKYADHNWRKGFVWSRLIGAALRHTFSFARGEDNDPETGISHLAHATCCLLFLLSFTLTKGGADDRVRT